MTGLARAQTGSVGSSWARVGWVAVWMPGGDTPLTHSWVRKGVVIWMWTWGCNSAVCACHGVSYGSIRASVVKRTCLHCTNGFCKPPPCLRTLREDTGTWQRALPSSLPYRLPRVRASWALWSGARNSVSAE